MAIAETFEPSSLNIRDIFCNGNVTYKVPDYQRRYSWTKDQLEALWGDLYESFTNDSNSCYFLGSIVVVKNENNAFELIDGQQRLTTLMIMTSVLNKTYPDISCPNPSNPDDDSSLIDSEIFKNCLYYRAAKKRLTLQTAVEYDSVFNNIVMENETFATYTYPTKAQMKQENPVYNFRYTATFFYKKFQELSDDERKRFIFFIFNNVMLIRIVCHSVPFAIKLFQVMNDRGMPLSSSDIIKSYILGRIEKEDGEDRDRFREIFKANWQNIENLVLKNDLKMDDFIIFYEYFKLKSNPKKQVIDELRGIIENKNNDIKDIIDEMSNFSKALEDVLNSNDPTIYSLMYIPWPTYVKTCLASAWHVRYGINIVNDENGQREDYSERDKLIFLMRRYFYLAFISGKTLNQIKQTSFNLLAAIIDKKPIEEIEKILNESISKYKMIRDTYSSLKDEVYGEDFLKPLLLSVEYMEREKTNTSFIPLNKELHMDHILPQAFEKDEDWNYIDPSSAILLMNTLGNMALLYYKKNEEALNKGFKIKCNIYQGKTETGEPNNSGATSFDTTREVVDVYEKENRLWNVDDIQRRNDIQISRIEKLLGINESMVENDVILNNDEPVAEKVVSRFSFSELGIMPGSILTWFNNEQITCKVIDDENVEYKGEKRSISGIACEILGYHVSGTIYFKFNGKTINQIRKDLNK